MIRQLKIKLHKTAISRLQHGLHFKRALLSEREYPGPQVAWPPICSDLHHASTLCTVQYGPIRGTRS